MIENSFLPLGKLPPALLQRLIIQAPIHDSRILLGPGIGLDCSVVDMGDRLQVFKSDPITFASEEIGWYAVQVAANDIATTGAVPVWYMPTVLLPEGKTSEQMVEEISRQIYTSCSDMGISVIGGHTEVTYGIDRPIIMGTMIGEVARHKLVTPRGAAIGDRILLTKGVPIEATSILAREFPEKVKAALGPTAQKQAADYLYSPGIGVTRDASLAVAAGGVSAMHDPTEGGLSGALWELAEASGKRLVVQPDRIPIPELSAQICALFGLNPLTTIASGALLLTASAEAAPGICHALEVEGITCMEIGRIEEGAPDVLQECAGQLSVLARPLRDDIARVFEDGIG